MFAAGLRGCGAFRNNPAVVADVMMELAREYAYSFRTIEFAVYCSQYDSSNYTEFIRAAGE